MGVAGADSVKDSANGTWVAQFSLLFHNTQWGAMAHRSVSDVLRPELLLDEEADSVNHPVRA